MNHNTINLFCEVKLQYLIVVTFRIIKKNGIIKVNKTSLTPKPKTLDAPFCLLAFCVVGRVCSHHQSVRNSSKTPDAQWGPG